MMRLTTLCLVSVVALSGAACAVSGDEDAADPTPATAPNVSKADGADGADRGCQIVLRSLAQPHGLPSNNVNGVNWVVYHGHVDVAANAGGVPAALFASRSTNGWWKVTAQPVDGAVAGYQRYRFVLDRNTVPMGDNTAWRTMRIDVIPFLERADGSRLFDHNRYHDDFANYVLTKDETRYGDDPAACH